MENKLTLIDCRPILKNLDWVGTSDLEIAELEHSDAGALVEDLIGQIDRMVEVVDSELSPELEHLSFVLEDQLARIWVANAELRQELSRRASDETRT